jgi:hypothetical protein
MVFREVSVIEIREVLRAWLAVPPSPTRSRSTPNPHRASRPPHPGPRHSSSPDPSCASTTATT